MIHLWFILKCPELFMLKVRGIIFPQQGEMMWFRELFLANAPMGNLVGPSIRHFQSETLWISY